MTVRVRPLALAASLVFVVLVIGLLVGGLGIVSGRAGGLPPWLLGVVVSLSEAVLIVPAWLLVVRRGGSWSELGFRPYQIGHIALGCSFLVAAFLFNALWALVLLRFGLEGQPDIRQVLGGGPQGFVLALVAAGIVAPVSEETFFRGLIQGSLRTQYGAAVAILVSAALFALFHLIPATFLPVLVLGIGLSLLYHISGSIWPGIILHAGWNIVMLTLLYAAPGAIPAAP
ncbi:MAG: lysostaphin resistance A-like protein [Anaerolineae bacterium]